MYIEMTSETLQMVETEPVFETESAPETETVLETVKKIGKVYIIYVNGVAEHVTDKKYKVRKIVDKFIAKIIIKYAGVAKIFVNNIGNKYSNIVLTMMYQNFLVASEKQLCRITVKSF
jgi:hypothetical protein